MKVARVRLFWHQSARFFLPPTQAVATNVVLPASAVAVHSTTLHAVMTDESARAKANAVASRNPATGASVMEETEIPRTVDFLCQVLGQVAPTSAVFAAAARDFPFQFVTAGALAEATAAVNAALPLRRNDRAGVPSLQFAFPATEAFNADPYAGSAAIRALVNLGLQALLGALEDRGMTHAHADLLLEDYIHITEASVVVYLRLLPTYRLVRRDRVMSEMTHLVQVAPPSEDDKATRSDKMHTMLARYRTFLEGGGTRAQ